VFQRDGGQCAECGSKFDLQYDHVIRWFWAVPPRWTTSSCSAGSATASKAPTCSTCTGVPPRF
jgi:hypothetical protein